MIDHKFLNTTAFPFEMINLTPEGGAPAWTVIAKASYALLIDNGRLKPLLKPLPPSGVDLRAADCAEAAIQYESDFMPLKPRADALCVGKACPPRGVAVTECLVGFGVGPWIKTIRVVGNRRWLPSLGGLMHRMSDPEPFKSIPVSFENAFGGRDAGKPDGFRFYAPNPIGKGYSAKGRGLDNLPLPNLEDPNDPIKSWRSRPRPMSFGPVGRTWPPRIKYAGTYDKRWLKERSPQLPEDFRDDFYNCAPEDQQIPGYLRGDEEVRVMNMHPEHSDLRFRLPGIRVRALLNRKLGMRNQFEEITMNLDTLWVDMEALQFVLVWRGRVSASDAAGQGPVLIVEESLQSTPLPMEHYRPQLEQHLAEELQADQEVEEAEKELQQMESSEAETSVGDGAR